MSRKIISLTCAFGLAASLLATGPARAQEQPIQNPTFTLGSIFLTILHLPVKLGTCVGTQLVGGSFYAATYGVEGNHEGGTNGREIGQVVKGACTGPWIIRPEQVKKDYE